MFQRRSLTLTITSLILVLIWVCTLATPGKALGGVHSASSATQLKDAGEGSPRGQLVIMGISGLRWEWVTQENAPALTVWARSATAANSVVRTVGDSTCPAEGWLTLGASQRVQDFVHCRELAAPKGENLSEWAAISRSNSSNPYSPHLGVLGETLTQAGVTSAALGPGAALALADSTGHLASSYADVAPLPNAALMDPAADVPDDPGRTEASEAYTRVGANADLVVADLGSIRYPNYALVSPEEQVRRSPLSTFDRLAASFATPEPTPQSVLAQVRAADARFSSLLNAVMQANPEAKVIVTSLADATDTAALGFFAMGNATALGTSGFATTESTRHMGLIQIFDVSAHILAHTAQDSQALTSSLGARIEEARVASADEVVSRLTDEAARSQAVRPLIGSFYLGLGILVIILFSVAMKEWWKPQADQDTKEGKARTHRRLRLLTHMSAWVASLPVASFLVNLMPWWRFERPGAGLFAGIAVISCIIAGCALALARFLPAAPYILIGGISALTLLVDVLCGTDSKYPLQFSSLLGSQPQVGGRFYGFSNAPFALFTAALLIMATPMAQALRIRCGRIAALLSLVFIAGVGAYVDGAPSLGADFGGPPALVVGFLILAFLVWGVRLAFSRFVFVCALGIAGVGVFCYIDYLKPPTQRSHLGRFVESLNNGEALNTVSRKLSDLVFGLPLPLAVVLLALACALIGCAFWFLRCHSDSRNSFIHVRAAWKDVPEFRMSATSVLCALAVGMVLNDSGVVILFVGLVLAFPLWVISVARTRRNPAVIPELSAQVEGSVCAN